MLLSKFSWFNRIYEFNQYMRDQWVAARAREIPSGSRVLDAGAGACPYRSFFSHCQYKALDFKKLEENQLLGPSGYGELDYTCDIHLIPVSGASFDAVLCTEVLEHVTEPIRVVQEFSRILKPGGKLLLTAPLGSGLHQEPYHYYGGFTPYWYRKFFVEAGFERIIIEPNGGFFKYFGQEAVRFARILAPWRGWRQLLAFPFWLFIFPFAVILPIWGYFWDSLDQDKTFTVGYHVVAFRTLDTTNQDSS
jgi:SAM-dependent methyltransferase